MFVKLAPVFALAAAVLGHMEFTNPCPRYSDKCTITPALPPGEQTDYDLKSPIASGAPLCHHNTPWPKVTDTWTPGTSVPVHFDPSGNGHSGGHCQFSLSYDGGNTFVVISEALQYCFFSGPTDSNVPAVVDYNIPLPANLPGTDHAVFAWSWVNASGNREFYMNCADVAINGPAGTFTGKQMTILNINGYPTIPEFLGNYNTGLQYYKNATQITVTGNGYGGGSGGTSSTSSAVTSTATTIRTTSVQTTSSTTQATTSSAPATSTSSAPTSTTSTTSSGSGGGPVAGGACSTEGAFQCADTTGKNANYFLCLYGQWVAQACSSGTACFQSGTSVSCGWPQ
ncbi:hypothetical protein GQ54DRAFT_320860 [Martensiomyces pterosporus]|nr:hypothetical protein GQ54DRAFT_320860 [Martensiomyces pterosporus]